jgi:hypothetical protein
MSSHVAGPRWAARYGVLGRDHIAVDMGAPCVLASHHPARPVDG